MSVWAGRIVRVGRIGSGNVWDADLLGVYGRFAGSMG